MRLYLVRHGQTYLNKYKRMQGWSDTPLTDEGKKSALICGEALRAYPITQMVTSDLGRTIETGQLIAEKLSLTVVPHRLSEFRETFFGSYEGGKAEVTWQEVARKAGFASVGDLYRHASISEIMDAFHKADPSGDAEDYACFIQRLKDGMARLQELFAEDDHIVVVTHGNTIRNLAYLIDSTVDCSEELVNAAISILAIQGDDTQLLSYNKQPFTAMVEEDK